MRNNPNDEKQISVAKDQFYIIILNKATTIKMLCCAKFASLTFHKGEGEKVARFEKILRFAIPTIFFFEIFFTVIDLIIS